MSLAPLVRKIRRNVMILLWGTGTATVLTFATVALNARALGAEGLGVLTMMQAYASLIIGIVAFGTQQPVIRLGAQALKEDNPGRLAGVIGTGILLDLLAAAVAGFAALAFLSLFLGTDPLLAENSDVLLVYVLTIFLSGVTAMNGVFRLFDRFHFVSTLQIASAGMNLAGSGVLLMVGAPLRAYILMYAATQALVHLAHLAAGLHVMRGRGLSPLDGLRGRISRADRAEFLRYSWTTWGTSSISSLRSRLDVLVLSAFSDAATVGVYGVARQLTGVLNKGTSAVSSAVFPEVSHLAAADDTRTARRLMLRLAFVGLIGGALCVALAHLAGPFILRHGFGAEFEAGALPLTLLVGAAAIMLSAASFGGFVQAFDSPKRLFQIYVVAIVPFLVSCSFLVQFYGMTGAALAQIAFSTMVWGLSFFVLHRKFVGAGK